MRSAPVRRVSLLLAVVAVVATSCGWLQASLSTEELEQCTTALLERLPVEPIGEDFGVTSEQVKLGPGIDGNRGYPPHERGTYLAIQLANTNSGPAWTEPDR